MREGASYADVADLADACRFYKQMPIDRRKQDSSTRDTPNSRERAAVLCNAEDKCHEPPDSWFGNGQGGLDRWARELALPDHKVVAVGVAVVVGIA
jgi:hypothetical protein